MAKLYSLVIVLLFLRCSSTIEFYVSPDGNDQNTGSERAPFATLERAKQAILNSKDQAVTVFLREGVYPMEKSLRLNDIKGSPEKKIVIQAYPGEKVHITGGKKLEGFSPLSSNPSISTKVSPSLRNHLFIMDLTSVGITQFSGLTPAGFGLPISSPGPELYFNGRPMTLARWPNEGGWVQVAAVPDSLQGGGFVYSGDRPKSWTGAPDIWLHGYWKWPWADDYAKVIAIDTINSIFRTAPPHGVYPYSTAGRFYAVNILEELDTPGEWYLDRNTGMLYLWPPDSLENTEIYLSLMEEPLVIIENSAHVTLSDIVFEYTAGAGIEVIGGADNLLYQCTIRNIGTVAVGIGQLNYNLGQDVYSNTLYNGNAGHDNGISGCIIHTCGEGGIMLGGGDRKTLIPGNNFVFNSEIYDCSRRVRTYRAGIFMYGVGNKVMHNEIHDLPHTAVFFLGNDHLLEFNDIHHVCMETGDAGAIYNGRDWSQRGSIIRSNYFHHLHGVEGVGGFTDVMAVYLDDWSSGATITGNIFYKAGRNVMIGGGRDNLVENNIFIEGSPALHLDARGLGWASYYFDGTDNTLFDRLKAVDHLHPPFSTRYPELKNILEDDPVLPKGNRIIRNINVNGEWASMLDGVNDTLFYFSDNITGADSSLYFLEKGVLHVKDNPKWFPEGFNPINLQEIGRVK